MQSMRLVWGSILALLMCAALSVAQTGSIQGTVTDSVGAVIQGAEVTVKNLGSNAARTVTSGGTGAYSIPSLRSRRLRCHRKDGELQDLPRDRC